MLLAANIRRWAGISGGEVLPLIGEASNRMPLVYEQVVYLDLFDRTELIKFLRVDNRQITDD